MEVLLTNDDGYQSPGLHALADGLSEIAAVTVVAPEDDQSGCGRTVSESVEITDIPRGFAVSGTPVDCVLVAIEALDIEPDIVVSGCNVGGNIGRYVLGRSGTVSAAVEATFFDLPAIATSLYVPEGSWPLHGTHEDFVDAVRATQFLVSRLDDIESLTPGGYLNVNAPLHGADPAHLRLTRPSDHYAMTAVRKSNGVLVDDEIWEHMDGSAVSESSGTDRGAVRRGHVSVSALGVPTGADPHDDLEGLLAEYRPDAVPE